MSDAMQTKQAMGEGLKTVCRTKSFDKVTVGDITRASGYNRQTFYYHFADKFELLDWVYYQDGFAQLLEEITLESWSDQLRILLGKMQADRGFYLSTVRCRSRVFSNYLFQVSRTLFLEAIEKLDGNGRIGPRDRTYFAEFYAYGCCGMVVAWAEGGMKEPAEEMVGRLQRLVQDTETLAWRLHAREEGPLSP